MRYFPVQAITVSLTLTLSLLLGAGCAAEAGEGDDAADSTGTSEDALGGSIPANSSRAITFSVASGEAAEITLLKSSSELKKVSYTFGQKTIPVGSGALWFVNEGPSRTYRVTLRNASSAALPYGVTKAKVTANVGLAGRGGVCKVGTVCTEEGSGMFEDARSCTYASRNKGTCETWNDTYVSGAPVGHCNCEKAP